jgi:hypothetical protein
MTASSDERQVTDPWTGMAWVDESRKLLGGMGLMTLLDAEMASQTR